MQSLLYFSILLVVSLVVYHNAYDCEFVFDDATAIKENKDLRPNTPIINLFFNDFWGTPMKMEKSHKSYRPLTVLTFRWNYSFSELDPVSYHIVNVVLHAVVTCLFFQFCCDYLEEKYAFVASLLFAVHPVHTEAVTGVVGRAELLSSIFFLLTLAIYRSCAKVHSMTISDWFKILVCIMLVAMGTLCKEQCITVIGVCCVYEALFVQKFTLSKLVSVVYSRTSQKAQKSSANGSGPLKAHSQMKLTIARSLVLVGSVISLLYARIRVMGAQLPVFTNFDNPAAHAVAPWRHLTYNYLLPVNMWLLLCPSHLCCDWTMGTIPIITSFSDPRNLATLFFYGVMAKLALTALTGKSKSHRVLGMGLALLVLPFIPATNLFFPVGFVVAERVLYTPSMGICLIVALGVQNASSSHSKYRSLFHAAVLLVVLVFSWKTYQRNFDWKSEYTLFKAALRVNTRNAKLWNNVGHTFEHDQPAEALRYFIKAEEVQPDDIGAIINCGRTYMTLNMTGEAEAAFKRALEYFPKPKKGETYHARLAPSHLKVFINLSNLLVKNGSRLEEADAYLRRAITMRSDFVDAYQNRGDILIRLDRPDEARQQYQIAIGYEPENSDLHYNLGVVDLQMGKKNEALNSFMKSLKFNPNQTQSMYNAAAILSESANQDHHKMAQQMFLKLVDLGFEVAQCFFSLAMMETDFKNFEKAEYYYLESLKVEPSLRSTLFNLPLLYRNEMNAPDKSMMYVMELLKHYPAHIKGLLLLGDIQLAHYKDFEAAYKAFHRVVELEPNNFQARHNLCVVMVEQGRLVEAEKCLDTTAQLAPQEDYIRRHLEIVRTRIQDQTVQKQASIDETVKKQASVDETEKRKVSVDQTEKQQTTQKEVSSHQRAQKKTLPNQATQKQTLHQSDDAPVSEQSKNKVPKPVEKTTNSKQANHDHTAKESQSRHSASSSTSN